MIIKIIIKKLLHDVLLKSLQFIGLTEPMLQWYTTGEELILKTTIILISKCNNIIKKVMFNKCYKYFT